MGLPAAIYRGNDSGHGIAINGHIHMTQPCGTTCATTATKPVAAKDVECYWPPTLLAPAGPYLRTVIINGIMPILDQDVLTPHRWGTGRRASFTAVFHLLLGPEWAVRFRRYGSRKNTVME